MGRKESNQTNKSDRRFLVFIVAPIGFLCLILVLLCSALGPFWICGRLAGEERAGCYTFIAFLVSSSWFRGLVCSVWLWHFLVILNFEQNRTEFY